MRQGQEADAGGSRARAEDGDSLGVPTEGPDVLLDPAQGLDLVQEPVVAFGRLIAGAQKACRGRQEILGSSPTEYTATASLLLGYFTGHLVPCLRLLPVHRRKRTAPFHDRKCYMI